MLITIELDLGAAVLAEEDLLASLDLEGDALAAVVELAVADRASPGCDRSGDEPSSSGLLCFLFPGVARAKFDVGHERTQAPKWGKSLRVSPLLAVARCDC